MSIEYQILTVKEPEHSFDNLMKKIGAVPEFSHTAKMYSLNDIREAYRFGVNHGFMAQNRYSIIGQIVERFFNQIHMHRAITLNAEKVREALDLISNFSTAGARDEDWQIYQDKIIKLMREFK